MPHKGTFLIVCDICVSSDGGIRHAVLARVLINDSLFVLCAVSLAVCIFKIAKMSSANVYLESKVEIKPLSSNLAFLGGGQKTTLCWDKKRNTAINVIQCNYFTKYKVLLAYL